MFRRRSEVCKHKFKGTENSFYQGKQHNINSPESLQMKSFLHVAKQRSGIEVAPGRPRQKTVAWELGQEFPGS